MAYEKTNWVNNQTPLNEVNLNKLEQGVKDAHDGIGQHQLEIDTIKDTVNNLTKIWTGTQAQYDAIGTKDANTLYFIM